MIGKELQGSGVLIEKMEESTGEAQDKLVLTVKEELDPANDNFNPLRAIYDPNFEVEDNAVVQVCIVVVQVCIVVVQVCILVVQVCVVVVRYVL